MSLHVCHFFPYKSYFLSFKYLFLLNSYLKIRCFFLKRIVWMHSYFTIPCIRCVNSFMVISLNIHLIIVFNVHLCSFKKKMWLYNIFPFLVSFYFDVLFLFYLFWSLPYVPFVFVHRSLPWASRTLVAATQSLCVINHILFCLLPMYFIRRRLKPNWIKLKPSLCSFYFSFRHQRCLLFCWQFFEARTCFQTSTLWRS